MSVAQVALLGAVVGIGLFVTLTGFRGVRLLPSFASNGTKFGGGLDRLMLQMALAIGAFVLTFAMTGWLAAAAILAIGAACAPRAFAARGRHGDDIAKVEAIAMWSEQVRDTLGAANGLEHAISASAALAPATIRPAIERLAARMGYEPLADALRSLADDLDHPLGDFVAAALVTAAEKQARDVAQLLGHLAECARDEARMRTRVWVGRARTRTAVRVMIATITGFMVLTFVTSRDYLAPYDTPSGQAVLALVGLVFAASMVLMDRMGRFDMPDRFIGRRTAHVGIES